MVDLKPGDVVWEASSYNRISSAVVLSVSASGKRLVIDHGSRRVQVNMADFGHRWFRSQKDAADAIRRDLAQNARNAQSILDAFNARYPSQKEIGQ